jgi:hypothetical protein
VLAEAAQSVVPTAVEINIGRVVGNGESATLDIAVRTTRTVSLDLASWEYTFASFRGVSASTCLNEFKMVVDRVRDGRGRGWEIHRAL